MKTNSLKLKISLWYTLILIFISSILLFVMICSSQKILLKNIEERVVTSVMELKKGFEGQENPNNKFNKDIHIPPIQNNEQLPKDFIPKHLFFSKGVNMAVYNNNFEIIMGQEPFGISDMSTFIEGARIENYKNQKYYVFDEKVIVNNNVMWIKGVASISDEIYMISPFVICSGIFILVMAFISGIGGYFILKRALIPVENIRKTAKNISESSDLSQRINVSDGKDELHELAETFNEMLTCLETSFNKEKQFTSDVSHELRTPIAVILSECEYGETCVDDIYELKEILRSIKNQGNKMSKLVSELLMISRMDNNKIKLNFEKTNISEILNFVCDEQEEIHNQNIELVRDIDSNIEGVVDTSLIARLFANLISNAYQYSNPGSKIVVSLKTNDNKIKFVISDTGIGIPDDKIDKIWNRFYQVNTVRDPNNTSSGLGLPMVKWISDVHNGSLFVESELNKGTTFSFLF